MIIFLKMKLKGLGQSKLVLINIANFLLIRTEEESIKGMICRANKIHNYMSKINTILTTYLRPTMSKNLRALSHTLLAPKPKTSLKSFLYGLKNSQNELENSMRNLPGANRKKFTTRDLREAMESLKRVQGTEEVVKSKPVPPEDVSVHSIDFEEFDDLYSEKSDEWRKGLNSLI